MRKIKEIDLTEILKPYAEKNLWVALNQKQNKVIGFGKTISEAIQEARKQSKDKPIIMKAVQDYSVYVPVSSK